KERTMRVHPRRQQHPRRGAALVEAAIAYPIMFVLTVGVIVIALGMFRYQQVAAVAREGARWASVHGGQYASETGNSMATSSTVYSTAMLPLAAGLLPSALNYSVKWDDSGEMPTYTSGGNTLTNHVTVTVKYSWTPEVFLQWMPTAFQNATTFTST